MSAKLAACAHHWVPIGDSIENASGAINVLLGCILCFKFAPATFEPLGYKLTAATVKAQRAARKR